MDKKLTKLIELLRIYLGSMGKRRKSDFRIDLKSIKT